jgi:hypothetical protein
MSNENQPSGEVDIQRLVKVELSKVSGTTRRSVLAAILIPPQPLYLNWEYGEPGERFKCWLVGLSPDGNYRLVYCDNGFGPEHPWGYVGATANSMGMDCQWHVGLQHAAIGARLLDAPPNYKVP